jgi:PhnB protein
MEQTKAIPNGFHTITPHLVVKGANRAIEFYKKAFGAREVGRLTGPDGKSIIHADLVIGDSHLFLVDENPGICCVGPQAEGSTSVTIHLYTENADALFNQAVSAGAQVRMPVADMFWGDRYGAVVDPFGHQWSFATHKEDVTPEEINKRMQNAFANHANG